MTRLLLTGGLCLALGACATSTAQSPPTCNGQHRRPANPAGSVLLTPSAPAVIKPDAAAPAPADGASYAPCGGQA